MTPQNGETIIETQFQQGAARRGFDFLSFTGTGKNAQLFVNEVKNEAGRVGSRRFTVFGLGKSGTRSFDAAMQVAEDRIRNAGLDPATQDALLEQMRDRSAQIRLLGGPATVFDPAISQMIRGGTGFAVQPGTALPLLP